jgi:pimeloyl-ACP methyl ester carboxylesterase
MGIPSRRWPAKGYFRRKVLGQNEGVSTYVLIHGAGSEPWLWHLVVPQLEALGHIAVAVDLPCDDDAAGLRDYAETVLRAAGDRDELILVAQSLAGFTAPLVCERRTVDLVVLVNAMVPLPGETAGEWWANTGHVFPDPFDPVEVFLHDVSPSLVAEAGNHIRRQSDTVFSDPWPLAEWPQVSTRSIACRDDRFFPIDFQRRVVRERLGIEPDEMSGGHLPALARPQELVELLEACRISASR